MNVNKVETISFMKTILASSTDIISERIKSDGTVEKIRVNFYSGPQGDLHVKPMLLRKGNKREELITYPIGTNQYLSGDNEVIEMNVNVSVENDDQIRLEVENVDATNDYTLNVQIEIDYYGGQKRVVGGVL